MNYLSDLHTHTIVSGHAYTTLMENINFCSKKGIKILGTSDHTYSAWLSTLLVLWKFKGYSKNNK